MKKTHIKMALDLVMSLLFVLLMSTFTTGLLWHELLGLFLFLLFLFHVMLNFSWVKSITARFAEPSIKFKTKFCYVLDFLLLLVTAFITVSGIVMSGVFFKDLSTDTYMIWKVLHNDAAWVGLFLISVHIGLHWRGILMAMRKLFGITQDSLVRKTVLRILAALIAIFGIKSFIDNGMEAKVFSAADAKEQETISAKSGTTAQYYASPTISAMVDDTQSLEEYLSSLICTACHRRCPLSRPACGRGVVQAQQAEAKYYAAQQAATQAPESSSSEAQTDESSSAPESNSSESSSDAAGITDDTSSGQDNSSAEENALTDSAVPESTAPEEGISDGFNLAETAANFLRFMPIMGLFVGGTYYIVEIAERRGRRKKT